MNEAILIVEDQFAEADYLQIMLTKAGYRISGIARSVGEARQLISVDVPDFVLLDIFLKGKEIGIDLATELTRQNIPFIYLSANSNEKILHIAKATQPYGFLVKPFREKDLLIMLDIARYRHVYSVESQLRKEHNLVNTLSAIANDSQSWDKKLLHIGRALQSHLSFDYITAGFNSIIERPEWAQSFLRIGFDEYQTIGVPELLTIGKLKMGNLASLVKDGMLYGFLSETFSMKSCTSLKLYLQEDKMFTFSFYSHHPNNYGKDYTSLVNHLQHSIGPFLESIIRKTDKAVSTKPYHFLPGKSISDNRGFNGIIGNSPLLLNVFDMITQVASSDTSVLILGESGTGKERIAECIHNLSLRSNKPLVKVNCATLPSNLIESELFGHEKGAFTGAMDKRIGKFEKADKGTIFLDEIGEMPVDLQVKLLRVLQERYIERIGAKDITPIDVRIIAATNRNLEKEVAERRFRLDLYYRLNVFPVVLPALRERLEDIPALAEHFIRQYNAKAGKNINGLSAKVLKSMSAYDWPGNIRELENLIERAVLLTKGSVIEEIALPSTVYKENNPVKQHSRLKTIRENERDYIISVLKRCKGKIWGPGGAAEILDLPSSTLRSKMKKLGIRKEDIEDNN